MNARFEPDPHADFGPPDDDDAPVAPWSLDELDHCGDLGPLRSAWTGLDGLDE